MKKILVMLRYLLSWITPVPWPYYTGITMLPAMLLCGLFFPRIAFGLAVWTFMFLLAVPLLGLPGALRKLLSNHRLMLLPGFAVTAVLTAFILTLLTAGFLPFFAWHYEISVFPPNADLYIFVGASLYVLLSFVLARMRWGLAGLGIFSGPLLIASGSWTRTLVAVPLFNTAHLLWITVAAVLGWCLALLLATRTGAVRPSLFAYESRPFQNFGMEPGHGVPSWARNSRRGSPTLSVLLGYPASHFSVMRSHVYAGVFGALLLLLAFWFSGFSERSNSWPKVLQTLLFVYLFSATILGFQNGELICRMRLLWLRAPGLRHEMWRLLETLHWLSQASLVLLVVLLAALYSLVIPIKPLLFVHYPLLILLLNAHTSYYIFWAKLRGWHWVFNLLVALPPLAIALVLIFAIDSRSSGQFVAFELLLLTLALCWRRLARTSFAHVNWQILKASASQRGATA